MVDAPIAPGPSHDAKVAKIAGTATTPTTPSAAPTTTTESGIRLVDFLPSHELYPGKLALVRRSSLLDLTTKPGDYAYNTADSWGPSTWSFDMSSKQELHVLAVTFRKKDTDPPRDGLATSYDVGKASPVVSPPSQVHEPPRPRNPYKSRAVFTWDMATSHDAREIDTDPRVLAVLPRKPGTIYLNSTACSGDYQFWVKVSFTVPDQPNVVYQVEKGPFLHYASARQMPFVTALYGNNTFLTNVLDHVSGHPAGCHGPVAPYPSRDEAISHLLVKYAAEVAAKRPDLGRPEVLDLVAAAVAPEYGATAISAMCDRAAGEHWLYQCKP